MYVNNELLNSTTLARLPAGAAGRFPSDMEELQRQSEEDQHTPRRFLDERENRAVVVVGGFQ